MSANEYKNPSFHHIIYKQDCRDGKSKLLCEEKASTISSSSSTVRGLRGAFDAASERCLTRPLKPHLNDLKPDVDMWPLPVNELEMKTLD